MVPLAHPLRPAIFKSMSDYPFNERAKYAPQYQVMESAIRIGADVTEMLVSADLVKSHGNGVSTVENIYRRWRVPYYGLPVVLEQELSQLSMGNRTPSVMGIRRHRFSYGSENPSNSSISYASYVLTKNKSCCAT